MLKRCIALQLLILLIKTKLLNNLINSLTHAPRIKPTILHQSLAVVKIRRTREPTDIPAVELGTKDGLGNTVVLSDGIVDAHAKTEEHDAHDTTCACTACELEVISWTGHFG